MNKKDIENLETMMWEGESPFTDFVMMTRTLGYKYIVKCSPLKEGLQTELGAACKNQEELIETLLLFSNNGYTNIVDRMFMVDDSVLNKLGITKSEFHLICDEMNGCVPELSELNIENSLVSFVRDGHSENEDVDIELFVEKIRQFTYKDLIELVCQVDEYWENGNDHYTRFGKQSSSMILKSLDS